MPGKPAVLCHGALTWAVTLTTPLRSEMEREVPELDLYTPPIQLQDQLVPCSFPRIDKECVQMVCVP